MPRALPLGLLAPRCFVRRFILATSPLRRRGSGSASVWGEEEILPPAQAFAFPPFSLMYINYLVCKNIKFQFCSSFLFRWEKSRVPLAHYRHRQPPTSFSIQIYVVSLSLLYFVACRVSALILIHGALSVMPDDDAFCVRLSHPPDARR